MATSFHPPTPSLGQQPIVMASLYQRRAIGATDNIHRVELLPNPDFVFPARSPEHSPSLSSSALPSPTPTLSPSLSPALGAAPAQPQPPQLTMQTCAPSAGARRHRARGSAALPDFTFNPAAAGLPKTKPINTPPHSPASLPTPTTPSGPRGHRRRGSEFIGGDGKGGAGLLSTSPVKGDADLPGPSLSSRLSGTGGRGHRHRRSGAISCHDLQTIMQPRDGDTRCGSAPATPLKAGSQSFFSPSQIAPEDDGAPPIMLDQTRSASDGTAPKAVPRVRVGFADRVEYIRPLSTISSGTESSMSTIRGTHSVSGSLSSVLSLSTSSPPSTRAARPALVHMNLAQETTCSPPKGSPSLFGVLKTDEVEEMRNQAKTSTASTPVCEYAPSSLSEVAKAPKRRSFGWWEAKKADEILRSSSSEPSLLPSPSMSPDSDDQSPHTPTTEEVSSPNLDRPAKQKKSRLWSRSLLSRKTKSHCNLKGKAAGDPLPASPGEAPTDDSAVSPYADRFHFDEPEPIETGAFEPNFDVDETVTIVSEQARPKLSLSPVALRLHADSDPMSPVIDLDAALGPFNTPPFGANTRIEANRPQPRARRSLHSLGYQSAMHHRRTESAPELEPFDQRKSKAGPTKSMPDVFEEEEDGDERHEQIVKDGDGQHSEEEVVEEDLLDDCAVAGLVVGDEASALGISATRATLDDEDASGETIRQTVSLYLPIRTRHRRGNSRSISPSSASERTSSVIRVFEEEVEPRTMPFTRDSDSTVSPPLEVDDVKAPRPLMHLQLPLPSQSVMTPETLTGSSFSSQNFIGSQGSLSTPRLGTATSSTTDIRSTISAEPVVSLRRSVDDVPSLSSSRSTMTTPPQHAFVFTDSYNCEQRTESVASTSSLEQQRQRSKRASVASLSRLIGVRSKLAVETRPQSQHVMATRPETPKGKKAKRLSKLMNFWKRRPSSGSQRESVHSQAFAP